MISSSSSKPLRFKILLEDPVLGFQAANEKEISSISSSQLFRNSSALLKMNSASAKRSDVLSSAFSFLIDY
jgi:hypothetical protein